MPFFLQIDIVDVQRLLPFYGIKYVRAKFCNNGAVSYWVRCQGVPTPKMDLWGSEIKKKVLFS